MEGLVEQTEIQIRDAISLHMQSFIQNIQQFIHSFSPKTIQKFKPDQYNRRLSAQNPQNRFQIWFDNTTHCKTDRSYEKPNPYSPYSTKQNYTINDPKSQISNFRVQDCNTVNNYRNPSTSLPKLNLGAQSPPFFSNNDRLPFTPQTFQNQTKLESI